jgi:hypothetical protein
MGGSTASRLSLTGNTDRSAVEFIWRLSTDITRERFAPRLVFVIYGKCFLFIHVTRSPRCAVSVGEGVCQATHRFRSHLHRPEEHPCNAFLPKSTPQGCS